ncbi:hypothetical protein D3C73_586940 [compost metagenome]
MQVVDVFQNTVVQRGRDGDVVEQGDVLHVLAQADTTAMGADRHVEFGGHQQHDQHLVETAQARRVQLAEIHCAGLEHLLEHHPVVAMLSGGDADRCDALADTGMAENVVGAGWLLDPQRFERGEAAHVGDRFIDVPDLIGVHHQGPFPADFFTQNRGATDVVFEIGADFLLDVSPAILDRFAGQSAHFFFAVAEPAGRGGVAGIAFAQHVRLTLGLARHLSAQQGDGFFRGEHVGDVAEVQATHQLFRRHVGQQFPHGFAFVLGPQVPDGVDDRRGGEVNHAFFRAQPAQLTVADGDVVPESAHVGDDLFQRQTDHHRRQGLHRRHTDFIATADGEGQAVAFKVCRGVGVQHDVGRGVIRCAVHRIGTVEGQRSGEADVANAQMGDSNRHGGLLFLKTIWRPDCRSTSDMCIIAIS